MHQHHATAHVQGDHPHDLGHATAPLGVLVIAAGVALQHATRQILAAAPALRAVELGRETVREANGLARHPDVVLLEVDARQETAESAVREVVAKWRPAPVLIVTLSEDRYCNRRLVRWGARGVVTHSRQAEHLVAAINRVHDGEIWLGRACMTLLIDEMVANNHPAPPHLASAAGLEQLTDREREVVDLIAQGLHNKAIAAQLGITDHTVRHHLTAVFAKLGVADRLELAVYAFRHSTATRKR